jgi:hypothetical protein
MKKLDFIGQTVIIVLTVLLFLASGGIPIGLAGILAIGLWQIVSCLISVLSNAPLFYAKIVHLAFSILFAAMYFAYENKHEMTDEEAGITFTLIYATPIALAVYYYIVTLEWWFRKPNANDVPRSSDEQAAEEI